MLVGQIHGIFDRCVNVLTAVSFMKLFLNWFAMGFKHGGLNAASKIAIMKHTHLKPYFF